LGILHITVFVTLCESYMGIDPHFDLWNHFFCIRPLQGSGAEVAVLGSVDIHVKFGHKVDPYFHLPVSKSTNGWWKVWFFLGTTPPCCSPCSQVAALSPNPTGGTEWPGWTSACCNLCARLFNSYSRKG
jgi:hypothetical protein